MENQIIEILRKRIDSIQKEDKARYDDDYKQHLNIEESVYRKLIEDIEYQLSSPEAKQGKRILQLAKFREQDWDVTDQLKEINLYSKIREVIPYIQAVSYVINGEEKHLTQDLLDFCQKWLDYIDSSAFKKEIKFPTNQEINEAFKSYLERIKPNRITNLKVYKQPEVNQKIEELYQEFLKLVKVLPTLIQVDT